jgi:hypothetical protein
MLLPLTLGACLSLLMTAQSQILRDDASPELLAELSMLENFWSYDRSPPVYPSRM